MLGEFGQRRAVSACVTLLSFFGSAVAAGAVTQPPPDSTPLPQPVPAAETAVATSRGFQASALTLTGLFQQRSEQIDYMADAVVDPGTFRPLCGSPVTAEFVLHGGGCRLALAWYNATGAPRGAGELYEIVPSTVTTDMMCPNSDFCPLAGTSTLPTQSNWVARVYSADICQDARFTGGRIGFALVGSGTQCSATKYSERLANVVCTSCTPNTPWITALIYRSRVRQDAYYLAFEDLPMSPTNWRAVLATGTPDGDFNDFVFHLTGVCHGNDACSTGGTGGSGNGGSSGGGAGNSGASNGGSTSGASNGGSSSGASNGGSSSGASNGGTDTGGSSSGASSGGSGNGGDTGGSATGGSDVSGAAGLGEAGDGTSGSSPGTCVPGREVACTCANGDEGSQRCLDDGRSFEPCVCGGDDAGDDKPPEGCGCRQAGHGEAGFWTFGAVALVALRRWLARRDARRRTTPR
jgi:hypothetical protein